MEILETPIKSEQDKKEYRLIRLENGLKVLLISKQDGKSVSAGALSIHVGSYDNPIHVPGLAHFFEHMIILSTGSYEENFKEYIESHNGYCNALTGNDFTSYEFTISDDKFADVLARFAEVFISPKLTKDLMQTERINVDSEFRLSKQNPMNRRAQIHRLYLNQNHHASIFPIGNLTTLKENISDDDLFSELMKFLDNYVANKMSMCIQSSKSLDELTRLVTDHFATIKKNEEIKLNYELPVDFDDLVRPEFYSKIIYIKENENILTFSWLVPPASFHYKSKPLDIISRIFHSNDEGALIPYLKDRNLITDLSINYENWLSSLQFTCFRLQLELTDQGYEKIEDILSAVYSYLLMLKETPREEYERLFNDIKEYVDNRYSFSPEDSAIENVRVCRYMNFLNDKDILRGKKTLLEYDEDILMDYIFRLNEEKFNITFMHKKTDDFNLHEDIFDIDYNEVDLPENFKTLWKERKSNSEFFMEKPNPYQVKNFEIFADNEELDHPKKIFKTEIIEIWHMLDRKFKQPIAKIEIMVMLKNYSRNAEMFVYMRLFSKIAAEIFNRKFSKSQKAGFSNSLEVGYDHIQITFDGYNDKMLMIIENTFIELKDIIENVKEELFDKKRTEYMKSLKYDLQSSRLLGYSELKKILSNNYFTNFDLLRAINDINFENFKNSIKEIFSEMKVIMLIEGNMRKEDALKISDLFQKSFPCEYLKEENRVVARGYQIPIGSHTLRIKSLHPTDDNSLIMNYYQIGPYSIHIQNLFSMIQSFLDPKAFDFLRTKSQLAYTVHLSKMKIDKICGVVLGVRPNENVNNFIKVHQKMEEFINELCTNYISNMTDNEFSKLQEGRISNLSEPNLTLSKEFSQHFREIKEEVYNFNRNSEAIDDARTITKNELQNFFFTVFSSQNARKLMIDVIGMIKSEVANNFPDDVPLKTFLSEKTVIDENIILDIEEFQKNLFLYPVNRN